MSHRSLLYQSGVAVVPFEDNFGRPVVFVRLRFHRPGNVEAFAQGLRTTVDAMIAHMLSKRQSLGNSAGMDGSNLLEAYVMVFMNSHTIMIALYTKMLFMFLVGECKRKVSMDNVSPKPA